MYLEIIILSEASQTGKGKYHMISIVCVILKMAQMGRSQDGGGIGRGDHFLFYKFIERTTER